MTAAGTERPPAFISGRYGLNLVNDLTLRPQSTTLPPPCCIFSATHRPLVFFFQKTVAIGENPD
jgi:hypothetical protein